MSSQGVRRSESTFIRSRIIHYCLNPGMTSRVLSSIEKCFIRFQVPRSFGAAAIHLEESLHSAQANAKEGGGQREEETTNIVFSV